MVDAGAQVINNSWGTNPRIINQDKTLGPDGGNTTVHMPVDTTAQTEYEYFYFKKSMAINLPLLMRLMTQ